MSTNFHVSISRAWSKVFFHDTDTSTAIYHLTATIRSSADMLHQISAVLSGENIALLDFDCNKVDIPDSHKDPLYLFDCGSGSGIEINLYKPIDVDDSVIICLKDGSRKIAFPEIEHDWSVTPETFLNSQVISSDPESISVRLECPQSTEAVFQTVQNGIFSESRQAFGAGRHIVRFQPSTLAASPLEYLGLSLNTTLTDGSDIEHKHVFLGRL